MKNDFRNEKSKYFSTKNTLIYNPGGKAELKEAHDIFFGRYGTKRGFKKVNHSFGFSPKFYIEVCFRREKLVIVTNSVRKLKIQN